MTFIEQILSLGQKAIVILFAILAPYLIARQRHHAIKKGFELAENTGKSGEKYSNRFRWK